jgi:hypothetical protein
MRHGARQNESHSRNNNYIGTVNLEGPCKEMDGTPPHTDPKRIRLRTSTGIVPVRLKDIVLVSMHERRPVVHVWNKDTKSMEKVHCTSRSHTGCLALLGLHMVRVRPGIAVNERFIKEVTLERIVHLKVPFTDQLVMGRQSYAAYLEGGNVF